MLLCGTGRQVINPAKGTYLGGYGADYPNEGVHDDLTVTALYLHDGQRAAFLLNFDLLGIPAKSGTAMRQRIAEQTGVPEDHIFLTCTHVHSGPELRPSAVDSPRAKPAAEYRERLQPWAVSAAQEAKDNAEPCSLRYNFTFAPGNMNRRYNFPDRRFLYIPNHKQLAGTSSEYVDPELGIIAFRKEGAPNRYKALITNYTAHPLCVGNSSNLVSADYQGVLRATVEETFAGCRCLATTGAAGDNHPLTPEAGFSAARELGTSLGQLAIMRAYDAVPADYDTCLRLGYKEVLLTIRDRATQDLLPDRTARAALLREGAGQELQTWCSLLGIGPLLLAGLPGEPVAELGAMLKWSSPFLKSYVLFMATDTLGYFPTVNQFRWGGYEAEHSRFARGSGEKLVHNVIAEAERLLQAQPLVIPALDAAAQEPYATR